VSNNGNDVRKALLELWYSIPDMKPPLCPVCGSILEIVRSSSDPGLSCPSCHWSYDSGQMTGPQNGAGSPVSFLEDLPGHEIGQDLFEPLLTVAKPRSLRWNWRMKTAVVLAILLCGTLSWTLTAHSLRERSGDSGLVLILLCWVTFLVSLPLTREVSNRRLLRDGEVAVGRVIYQQTVQPGKDSWSAIFYAFADGGNRGFVGRGCDLSNSLGQGAPLIVFYDPLNPNKNVAQECSRLSVRSSH
jgi:hypothetical protein